MIVELDAGNSRIKWRRLAAQGGAILDEGVCADHEELINSDLAAQRPALVRMCSVRGADVNQRIREWVALMWGLELQVAAVTRQCGGLTNQYQDLSRMGADRWLAMIAAYNRQPGACVVVDAGTALTVDMVDAEGLHLGGYILPGRRLMAQSLEANTQIRLQQRDTGHTDPGNSTDSAVLNGILASQVALLEWVLETMSRHNPSLRLYLAGGDAPLLARHVADHDPQIVASLVLDGLAWACPAMPAEAR